MIIRIKEKEFKVWLIVSIVIVMVWASVIWMLSTSRNNNQIAFLEEELKGFEGEVQSTLITYEAFSNYIFDEIDQEEDIKLIWVSSVAFSFAKYRELPKVSFTR